MKVAKLREWVEGDRIFAIALVLSFGWHLFWISSVKIVGPRRVEAQFSKVAFLGPILEEQAMEVRAGSAGRSILEQRYLDRFQRTRGPADRAGHESAKYEGPAGHRPAPGDETLVHLIDEAVSGQKMEP